MSNGDDDNRLVRIETRLVKYQEANVQQLMGIHKSLELLCDAINLLTEQLKEHNHER